MPATIPYDASLVLKNTIHTAPLNDLDSVLAQALVDKAEDMLHSLLALRRTVDMTRMELLTIGIDPYDLDNRNSYLDEQILEAARDCASAKVLAEKTMHLFRAKSSTPGMRESSPDIQNA